MPMWAKTIMLFIGLAFIGLGIGLGFFVARQAQANAERAARLQPLSAAAFKYAAPANTVLVEGSISSQNPLRFRTFVAYSVVEYRGEADDDGDPKWELLERVTPPLFLDAGGLIALSNNNYQLQRSHAEYQDQPYLRWDGWRNEGTKIYSGLIHDGTVMVIGTVTRRAAQNELEAEFVFAGTRAEYISDQRQTSAMLPWVGLIFGLAGVFIVALGFWEQLPRFGTRG
ncbi:MAG: hypothetical protein EI684_20840 [Candidatus Viridilinea halotolerans]|uniref:Uncharacterized protein n=1 Tax=Candidatus Viridilinea halotolerans TaxID=2491704 RepID=A0A426TRS2_9CHLR|nr:MAG: hypothetical protein EI684_20840 [Candidatus Viridilinea halotolerans]